MHHCFRCTRQVLTAGKGTLLVKMDIKHAYCNISEDWHLLVFQWNGHAYVETILSFGFRLAPFLFTKTVDTLLWIMKQNGVSWAIHYVDDFLMIGTPRVARKHLEHGHHAGSLPTGRPTNWAQQIHRPSFHYSFSWDQDWYNTKCIETSSWKTSVSQWHLVAVMWSNFMLESQGAVFNFPPHICQ